MKGHEFYKLRNVLNSLNASTFLRIEDALQNVAAIIDGRCSSLISHRSFEFEILGSPDLDYNFKIENRNYAIYIGPRGRLAERLQEDSDYTLDSVTAKIPTRMLGRELNKAIDLIHPSGCTFDLPLVTVVFTMPRLDRWNEDGTPVYATAPEVTESTFEQRMAETRRVQAALEKELKCCECGKLTSGRDFEGDGLCPECNVNKDR